MASRTAIRQRAALAWLRRPAIIRYMKTKLLIAMIVVAAITLALSGWTVQGIRWTLTSAWSSRRARLATA